MRLFLLLFLLLLPLTGCATLHDQDDLPAQGAIGAIPKRAVNAMKGGEFLDYVAKMTVEQREAAILAELRAGNLPGFLRQLKPVNVTVQQDGRPVQATYWVMPDYLAIGSDDDYVYMPMNPLTAQRVADHYAFVLPTRKMVDDIYAQSTVRLTPSPLPPGNAMITSAYYRKHNAVVQDQLRSSGHAGLITGHKKDVVVTNKLCAAKRRVAIYGWHRTDGRPIQPLSTVHGETYADYSHGIRLVANMMIVDGVLRPVVEVMQNMRLAPLISDEGILRQTRIAIDCTNC